MDRESALQRAYRYLGHRARTVAEVRRYLLGRGATDEVAEGAVEELLAQGYLDDDRFAREFAEDRRRLDSWGSERIERRLLAFGIEPALAARVAGDRGEDDAAGGELGAAIELLRRRWPAPPRDDRDRERALGMLVRRGYELELAYDAVRALERDAA